MAMELSAFIANYNSKRTTEQADDIRYLSVEEYAERTNRSPVTVRAMCKNGRIDGAVKCGKLWRIPAKESKDYQELKREYNKAIAENAALKERLECVKALLELPSMT